MKSKKFLRCEKFMEFKKFSWSPKMHDTVFVVSDGGRGPRSHLFMTGSGGPKFLLKSKKFSEREKFLEFESFMEFKKFSEREEFMEVDATSWMIGNGISSSSHEVQKVFESLKV